jgi:hypothetical protein
MSRASRRFLGEPAASAEAEELILDAWAELHARVLGYPPSW